MEYTYNEKYRYIKYRRWHKQKTEDIFLTKTQNRLFKRLNDGQIKTYQELIEAIYDVEDDYFYKSNLQRHIFELNKKIEPIGKAKPRYGVGYKLEFKEDR